MRIITVYDCRGCPYFTDFYCRKSSPDENGFYRVVPKENREKGVIPDWCPLPTERQEELINKMILHKDAIYEEGN